MLLVPIVPGEIESNKRSALADSVTLACSPKRLKPAPVERQRIRTLIAAAGVVAVFDINGTSFRGTIKMNMGGKNMTMSETQAGKRMGDCR